MLLQGCLVLSIVLAMVTGFGRDARAESATPAIDLVQLMQRLAAIKSSTASFTERRYLRVLKTAVENSGTLSYTAPAQLQKETLQPKPERLVLNGNMLTIEREGKTQTLNLDENPEIGGFVEGIRATLAGDLPTLQRYYTVSVTGQFDAWELLLQPRGQRMASMLASILIYGKATQIERVDTQEGDGDRTEMVIVPKNG